MPQPTYEGQPLSAWLALYCKGIHNPDPGDGFAEMDRARLAVLQIGTNATPFLVSWLRCEPPAWKHWLSRAVRAVPLSSARLLSSLAATNHSSSCELALAGFKILGARAAPVCQDLDLLIHRNRSQHVQRQLLLALTSIGSDALPSLLHTFDCPYSDHALAATLLGGSWSSLDSRMRSHPEPEATLNAGAHYFGTNVTAAVPVLARFATNADPRVAEASLRALASLALEPSITAPVLGRYLETCPPGIGLQETMARTIVGFGEAGRPAIPSLLRALRHPDAWTRTVAYNALLNMDSNSLAGIDKQSLGLLDLP